MKQSRIYHLLFKTEHDTLHFDEDVNWNSEALILISIQYSIHFSFLNPS